MCVCVCVCVSTGRRMRNPVRWSSWTTKKLLCSIQILNKTTHLPLTSLFALSMNRTQVLPVSRLFMRNWLGPCLKEHLRDLTRVFLHTAKRVLESPTRKWRFLQINVVILITILINIFKVPFWMFSSMMGFGEEVGVIPRFCEELFSRLSRTETKEVTAPYDDCSFMIYDCIINIACLTVLNAGLCIL